MPYRKYTTVCNHTTVTIPETVEPVVDKIGYNPQAPSRQVLSGYVGRLYLPLIPY